MKSRFLLQGDWKDGETISLSSEESHHLARVLRIPEGAEIDLINGKGRIGSGTVVISDPKRASIRVEESRSMERRSNITIAFGIPKSTALDFILHRCTELGVAGFQPLVTDHSLHPKEWNAERWKKVIAEVCKQCQEPWFPELHEPLPLKKWIETQGSRFVYCSETKREGSAPKEKIHSLLIGPEGGWSVDEIKSFERANGTAMGLGQNRLRTETAALVATTLLKKALTEI